jgi:hypothetical protein
MTATSRLTTLFTLGVSVVVAMACGSSAGPGAAASTPPATSSVVAATPPATASSCPTAAPRAQPTPIAPLPTPVAAFVGTGGNQIFARVESVDVSGQQVTVTFPRGSTGTGSNTASPAQTPGPATWQATLRVTAASVLQQLATTSVSLAMPIEPTATILPLAPGAPAVTAKSGVVVMGLDACKLEVRQPATLAQSAPAGAGEWVLAAAVGKAFGPGSTVVAAEVKPLPLGDLKPGDLLAGVSGPLLFGLTFSGTAPNLVLTRLLRACKDDPCPRLSP